jgi:hypothetical protein
VDHDRYRREEEVRREAEERRRANPRIAFEGRSRDIILPEGKRYQTAESQSRRSRFSSRSQP